MSRPGRSTALLIAVLMLAALPACRSTTWSARFIPTPAQIMVGPLHKDGGPPVARMLISVRGAERRGGDPDAAFEMHLRLRVENQTRDPLELLLDNFLLLDANLEAFHPARTDAPEGAGDTLTVPAGQPLLVDLMFPFPDGLEPDDMDLDGLNLRGALRSDQTVYPMGVTFTREPRVIYRDPWYGYYPYYGPWAGPGYGFYGGYQYRW